MRLFLSAALAALALGGPALGQIAAAPLPTLDLFSPPARETGLPSDLWKGTAAPIAADVLAQIGRKPPTGAAADLARRVLATGGAAPDGAGRDLSLAAARVTAMLALGDVQGVTAIADRLPQSAASPALAQAAAEAALLLGDDEKACRLAAALTEGRDEIYWLRLRAFCAARSGPTGPAQLAFDLAEHQAHDPVFARMMTVVLAGAGDPGAASLRNGLDYALDRKLALDVAPAIDKAPPVVAAALAGDPALAAAARTAATARAAGLAGPSVAPSFNPEVVFKAKADDLFTIAASGPAKARPNAQGAILQFAALGVAMDATQRTAITGFPLRTSASAAKLIALDLAADAGRKGETALLAVSIALDAGGGGLPFADRARIVRALMRVGLDEDGRAFAYEGLAIAEAS